MGATVPATAPRDGSQSSYCVFYSTTPVPPGPPNPRRVLSLMDRHTHNQDKNISTLSSLFRVLDDILVKVQDSMYVVADEEEGEALGASLDVYDAIVKLRDDIFDVKAKLRRRGIVVEFPNGMEPDDNGAIAIKVHHTITAHTTTTTTTTVVRSTTSNNITKFPYGGLLN